MSDEKKTDEKEVKEVKTEAPAEVEAKKEEVTPETEVATEAS